MKFDSEKQIENRNFKKEQQTVAMVMPGFEPGSAWTIGNRSATELFILD